MRFFQVLLAKRISTTLNSKLHQLQQQEDDFGQMLGCGAHVREIALPHVRCACGSACGKAFETVRAMCVRVARFGRAMCDRTFHPG